MRYGRVVLVAALGVFLAGCASPEHPGGEVVRAPAVPTTSRAQAASAPERSIDAIATGPKYVLPGHERSVMGYIPGRGLLIAVWPGTTPDLVFTSPGRLLLVDAATGSAKDLMGPSQPGVEPVMSVGDGDWVLWGQAINGMGPRSFFLYNLRTGEREPLNGDLARGLSGAAIADGHLYVADGWTQGGCVISRIVDVSLATGSVRTFVEARDCSRRWSPRLPQVRPRKRGPLPLHLRDLSVGGLALAGSRLYFVVSRPLGLAPISVGSPPSALVELNLASGATREVAKSPDLISAVAADSQVVAFVTSSELYALTKGDRLREVDGTSNPMPSVSGPLVTCGGEMPGQVYDSRTGIRYDLPKDAAWPTLLGSQVTWQLGPTIRIASLSPASLR